MGAVGEVPGGSIGASISKVVIKSACIIYQTDIYYMYQSDILKGG